jgi:hypothetical protein
VMVGFFLQLLLEKMSQGVEHGHLHLDQPHGHDHGSHHHLTHPHTSWGLLIGLSILPFGGHAAERYVQSRRTGVDKPPPSRGHSP